MSKPLALAGLVISGLIVVLFLADLAAAFPFGRTSWPLDLAFIAGGLIVSYLSWSLLDQGAKGRRPSNPGAGR